MIRLDTHLGHAVIFEDNITEDGWLIWQGRGVDGFGTGFFYIWDNGQNFNVLTVGGTPDANWDAVYVSFDDAIKYVNGLT